MLRAASCQACKNLEKFLPPHSYIYIYIYIYICRTHRFSVTLSFAPKRSSDRTLLNEEHTSLYTN